MQGDFYGDGNRYRGEGDESKTVVVPKGPVTFVLDNYQKAASKTCLDNCNNINYLTLGLVDEAGEVAGKVKRIIREDGGKLTEERAAEIADELGDVAWYLSQLARVIGYDLSTITNNNLRKLQSRQERGVIAGQGDNR